MALLWLDNFGYVIDSSSVTNGCDYLGSCYSQGGHSGQPALYYPSSRNSEAGYLRFGYRAGFALHVTNCMGDYDSLVWGCAMLFDQTGYSSDMIQMRNASGAHITVSSTGNTLQVKDANGANVGSSFSVPVNQWYYFEMKVTLGNSTGACEIRINGEQKVNFTNQDFLYSSGSAYIEKLEHYDSDSSMQFWMSEIYVTDGEFLGPIRVRACYPDEDSATHTDFTPSSGSDHYAMVDETAYDDDSTYNTGSQEEDKDTYLFDTSSVVGPVRGVSLMTRATRTGGSALKFKNMVRVGSTDYDGGREYYTDIGYDDFHQVWGVNPNTSSAWTTGEIASAEFGVHITGLSTTTTTA